MFLQKKKFNLKFFSQVGRGNGGRGKKKKNFYLGGVCRGGGGGRWRGVSGGTRVSEYFLQ